MAYCFDYFCLRDPPFGIDHDAQGDVSLETPRSGSFGIGRFGALYQLGYFNLCRRGCHRSSFVLSERGKTVEQESEHGSWPSKSMFHETKSAYF
jgi:hypothetical protein